ncbi:MAG TPA: autotransporter outer membrane beta-barrel domain-containing protein [Candidatus Elarobacter sp.]|nr:autotransporter outer membrane beta-barrel domain-containing protein [Candidatus Elarobacter sp.]
MPTPVASPQSVTTGQSTAVSIDPTIGARGGPFTSVSIVTPPNPATGTAAVQGLKIVFTPAVTFTGSTTFTFALSNATATSAPALITVRVQGRTDPSKDADVNALVTAMTDATERFIGTQMTNLGDRMGSLHGGDGGTGGNGAGLSITVNGHSLATLTSDSARELMVRTFGSAYDGATAATPSLAPNGAASRVGVWADATFGAGSHNGTPSRTGLNFGETEVSAGVDFRANDRFTFGISGGYAHDANDLISGRDQGTRQYASDVALYGTLRVGQSGFVDALIGWGRIHFDTRRFDPNTFATARGSRDGDDAFASITTGQRFRVGKFSLEPYAGLTADEANLRAFTETGAGIGDLTYGDQAIREVSAVAGLRADAHYATRIGIVAPHLDLEYGRRLSATSVGPVWYADRPDTVFNIPAHQIGSQPLTLGAGTTLRLPSGWLFYVDYRSIIDRDAVRHLLQLQLSTKL